MRLVKVNPFLPAAYRANEYLPVVRGPAEVLPRCYLGSRV